MKFEVGVNYDGIVVVEANSDDEAAEIVNNMTNEEILSHAGGYFEVQYTQELEDEEDE